MFGFIKDFFVPLDSGVPKHEAPSPKSPEDDAPLAHVGKIVAVTLNHWPSTGLFPVGVVGTSYHRRDISELALNADGKPALVYCTATLTPERDNMHDRNAIAVFVEGKQVGYLSKEYAVAHRRHLAEFGLDGQTTTCDAVISNGLVVGGKAYSYSVELDLGEPATAPTRTIPTYPSLDRRNVDPTFHRNVDGSYSVPIRLGPAVIDDMNKYREIHSWTTDHWTSINYYALNSKSAGLGHRLFSIEKPDHFKMFGDSDVEAVFESIDGRSAVVRMRAL
jgi:hypothetical protein